MIRLSIAILTIYTCFCCFFTASAQNQPADIKYGVLNLRALRYYPEATDATKIIEKVLQNKESNNYTRENFSQYNYYQKTSLDIVANKVSLDEQLASAKIKDDFVYKHAIRPFEPWLEYARPAVKNPSYQVLTTLIYENYQTVFQDHRSGRSGSILHASRNSGLFEVIGQQNISYLLDEVFGDIDLYQNQNEIMLLSFKSPLAENAMNIYKYLYMGMKRINKQDCYEVAFFCENKMENAFAGSLFISSDGKYSLVEAQFTLNNPENMNFLQNILITHTYTQKDGKYVPSKRNYSVLLGDEIKGCIVVDRTCIYSGFDFTEPTGNKPWENTHEKDYADKDSVYWQNIRPINLSPAEAQIDNLLETATLTSNFRNVQNAILILLNNHIVLGGIKGKVELGPLTQFVSYNKMEGLRLKFGGNTTVNLADKWQLGGYLAYGTTDEQFKYRANLIYSLLPRNQYIWEYPKNLISLTYVNDLNIPGQDLLTTNRDNLIYSFSHASTNNMSQQKIGLITFDNELLHHFSYKIGGQYKYDKPLGVVQYMQVQGADTTVVPDISTSEIQLSLRFSPREKFIQARDKRISIRRGDVELNLNHRIGIKDVLGSGYSYQITELSAYKKMTLGNNAGSVDLRASGGKVWNRVPFPLLFIPMGNQSYIFEPNGYNCMNFYEFTTDNYVAGNASFMFNWSPIKLLSKKDKIKTSLGARLIYGPLSDNNNPALHPELFVFNQGVNPLGNTPYAEINIGLANILKLFRFEYVRRLTYLDTDEKSGGHKIIKGSLFLSGSFSF